LGLITSTLIKLNDFLIIGFLSLGVAGFAGSYTIYLFPKFETPGKFTALRPTCLDPSLISARELMFLGYFLGF